jgi:dienelactone hydrolase
MKRRKFLYTGVNGIAGASVLSAGFSNSSLAVKKKVTVEPAVIPEAGMSDFEKFEEYEKLFAQALINMPKRNPASVDERAEIVCATKSILGISDELIPRMVYKKVGETDRRNFVIEHLTFESWKDVFGSANLYLPRTNKPFPFVLLCCGHGSGGKLYGSYQAMAAFLASNGMAVLVPDNIGQGEREPMGHSEEATPFVAGMSVQGLIVMEHIAHINKAITDSRFDPERIAAIGNSGGGTATCFLGALVPELAALVSSGYPSTFNYIARKEKRHCCCNILPGIVGELEMWQLYGCFAPKPLLIFNGIDDNMFPWDLFRHVSRKIKHVYNLHKSTENFTAFEAPGLHGWDEDRIQLTGTFLSSVLNVALKIYIPKNSDQMLSCNNVQEWPPNALDVDGIVRKLTNIDIKQNIKVEDLFYNIAAENDSSKRIFSQFELFLNGMI